MKKGKVRLLTKTLAVVSLLAPVSGHSLGIGDIKLHSALNQNLDAEISLSLSGENVSDIKVNLAPPEKFSEAGVSWNYFLSKIKFETVTRSNGSAVIKLTSKEALKEPFLDFLLEVSWPKGSLYREFTVLVDPPSVYNQASSPISTNIDSYAQTPVAAPQRQAYTNGQSSDGEYGPTLGNDTLWSVAERARGQSDVSVEQMMMAIFEANPHAFYKGNVYALTTGKMLKIPEREAVLKLSRNQALEEFNRHTRAWKTRSVPAQAETAKKKPVSSQVEERVQSKAEEIVDNQLKLVAPAKAVVADHAVVAPVNEQVSAEKKTADASKVVSGKAEGASETAPADSEIQSKIAALEKQLVMMQELIALKDQQLAALQNQVQVQANPVVQERVVPAEAVAKPVDQAAVASQQAVPKPAEQTQQTQQAAQPGVDSSSDFYSLGMGGAGAIVLTLLGWLWWRKRKVDEETNTESMFASTLIKMPEVDEPLTAPVVEEGVVHNAGTVGESSFLNEFTPSDFDSFDTDQGEIDPISEADVYLAYGRYQQAEELIRQAIKDQPNRDECKLKLLEIFYANEDKAAFDAYANELAEAGKRNEAEFWEQATEMGRDICPDSPLFSSGDDLFAVAGDADLEHGDGSIVVEGVNREAANTGAVSFETLVNENVVKEAVDVDRVKHDSFVDDQKNNDGIDFDSSLFLAGLKETDEAEKGVIASAPQSNASSVAQVENIDFDLNSFSTSADVETADEAEKDDTAFSSQLDGLDFDLSSFSTDVKAADEAEKDDTAFGSQLDDLDFDLSLFSADAETADDAEKGGAASSMQIDGIDFDLSSFSSGAQEADEKTDKDINASGGLSGITSVETNPANKKQAFESYEFDFSPNHESDDLDFSALESGDKSSKNVDFDADRILDFNDDLEGVGGFDFDFDLDLPLTTKGKDSNQYDAFGVSDLTDMDELETKLDLAKAYIDMGDADAAKDVAREVLERGTAEQKKTAQGLLDELD
ncbi:FimV/HubP family polar landmark protein [Methylobacter sp. Wu8]|uniref:FimV/HubP family polar landmark protein n=1 Tax=Methylobacter sp. Wu8 TaxID=3118457 RepID=UPI002F34C01B